MSVCAVGNLKSEYQQWSVGIMNEGFEKIMSGVEQFSGSGNSLASGKQVVVLLFYSLQSNPHRSLKFL